jgi:hypothetical protein
VPSGLAWLARPNGSAFSFSQMFFNGVTAAVRAVALTDGAGPRAVFGIDSTAHVIVAATVVPEAPTFLTQASVYGAANLGMSGPDTFGEVLRRIHDVDGDGTPEIAVSTVGMARGGTDIGLIALSVADVVGNTVDIVRLVEWTTPTGADGFGTAFATAGDLIGSAAPELAIGAPLEGAGRLYVAVGGATSAVNRSAVDPPAALSAQAAFGGAVEAIGDLDGDGKAELLVGAPFHSEGGDLADCDGERGAPPAYAGDCAGAIAVVRGADVAEPAALNAIDPTCVATGVAGERLGAALRALEPSGAAVRVAVGAPAHATKAGNVYVYTIAMDVDGACTLDHFSVPNRNMPGDRFGFSFGM